MYLSHRLGLESGKRALDVGCGVGGPARVISRFSEAYVVGLNNNAYQIERCNSPNCIITFSDPCKGKTINKNFPIRSVKLGESRFYENSL
jgi:sterol 24-C-methyltransferase